MKQEKEQHYVEMEPLKLHFSHDSSNLFINIPYI